MNDIFRAPLRAASLIGLTALAAGPALATDESAPADEATIVVTGTRRADRTIADSPVPVDVISAENLARSGYTDTSRLLNTLVPSFNFPQPSITDGTDVVRPATLRGLDPDQTLVLVNGKRRHASALLNINGSVGRGTAAVDINLIPSIALSRVEVLRDGAAAQYGSDAIAGVINFQLRNSPRGGQLTFTLGEYDTDVRGVRDVTGVLTGPGGTPILNPDGTLAVERADHDRHVVDGTTFTIAGTVGVPLGDDGHLNLSAEFQGRDPTNRTGPDTRRQYNLVNGALDPRELAFDRISHRFGDAKTDDVKLFANAGLPVGENVELYSYLSYGSRDGQSAGFYRLASDARNVPAIYPDGFLPLINTDLRDFEGVFGAKGEIAGWQYDLSASYGRNAFDFRITNSLNRSFGAESPTEFDSGGLRYSQAMANLDVSRDLTVDFLNDLTLAGGLEYRRETFRIRPGETASFANGPAGGAPGAQVFPGFQPEIGGQRVDQQRSRHNVSAYAELDADVNDRLNVQAAGRYEHYSDFGSSLNGKLAARFELADGLALRGAASSGFRAPSLQQQFYAAQATNNVNGVLLDTVTLPVDNPVALALGSKPLKPEKSLSLSGGLVVTALPRLNLTIDAYRIDIDDRIVVTENLTATRDAAGVPIGTGPGFAIAQILNAAGFPTVNAARFFVNGLDSRTRGIDAVVTYRFSLGDYGKLGASAGLNYNKTTIRRLLAAPGPLANVPGLVLFGRQEQGRLVRGQPRTKINLGLDYDLDRFGLTLRANRYGKVEATGGELGPAGSDVFNDNFLKAQWVADTEARFTFAKRLELAVGANNILDSYPTPVPRGQAGVSATNGAPVFFPATNNVTPFSSFSPNGFNGRFLYVRGAVKF